ncbi:MAG: hypothetical protein GF411_14325 [Candidatus Lokiarchaeota archaeon]|nr:hypothetical protein [Candidatus Lokiarchaeota archaeon]
MHIVLYTSISEKNNQLEIKGPYFYGCHEDKRHAEKLAREITNNKTKDVIMTRIFQDHTVPNVMFRAKDTWFPKFKERTIETSKIINRDQNLSLCPFKDINLDKLVNNYIRQ